LQNFCGSGFARFDFDNVRAGWFFSLGSDLGFRNDGCGHRFEVSHRFSPQELLADAKPEIGSETEAFDVDAFVMAMESVPERGHIYRWREQSSSVSNTAALSVETRIGATHDKAGK